MSDALPLPPRPNLEHYKKIAKDLLKACRSSDRGAIRAWAARWVEKLVGIDVSSRLYDPKDPNFRRAAIQLIERLVRNKLTARRKHFALADTQLVIAKLHGFASWPRFADHVEGLKGANTTVSQFEAAADAVVHGDVQTLTRLLRQNPSLVRERSMREHGSTLLHYVSANGIEDFRQKTPANIEEVARLLLESGADVNAESDAYGGGSTTLGLTATSCHPADAGLQIPLLQLLLDFGARMDQPSAAGNAQSVIKGCFANGQPVAAEFLASRGAPLDLEDAIALGRLDIVKSYFDASGALLRDARKQQVESGFFHACGTGRRKVIEFLLERGVTATLKNRHGQSGLHWAAYGAQADVVKLLLARGVNVNAKEEEYGGTPLGWALYGWANSRPGPGRDFYCDVVAMLIGAGAKIDSDWLADPDRGVAILKKIEEDPRMAAALGSATKG